MKQGLRFVCYMHAHSLTNETPRSYKSVIKGWEYAGISSHMHAIMTIDK